MDMLDFETVAANERPYLVRLCTRYVDDPEVAEDLAQETLLAAWKNQAQLSAPEKLRPWLSAIARNTCFAWLERRRRQPARQFSSAGESQAQDLEDTLADDLDLELELDRFELAALLDRALALLPAETAHMLVAHYIQEAPQAEIAARLGINPGTVAVRLQRGKLSLQRLLHTQLRPEAVALGLVHPDEPHWEETNIWCPTCGQAHLLGRFQKSGPEPVFLLRCPRCNPDPGAVAVGLDLSVPCNARLLGNLRMYKPAYARIQAHTGAYFRAAMSHGSIDCPACRRPVAITVTDIEKTGAASFEASDLRAVCPRCGWASNTSSHGLVLALPQAQQFWRANPRLRIIPGQPIEAYGSPAIVTRLRSLTGAAELAVISRRDTFEPLGVHTNSTL